MLLALIVLTQQIPDIRSLPIPPEAIKPPVMAGFQEQVLGIRKLSSRTYSLMENELDAGKYGDKTPINYPDVRIGQTTWSVTPAVYGSDACLALQTKANRNQAWEYRKFIYELRHRGSRTWFVTEDGKLLAETCDLELATGRWTMDVAYGADEYTVTFTSPRGGKRTQTVTPGCGMEALTKAPFAPMLKLGRDGGPIEVLSKEKEYYMLDPMTVSPVKYVARVSGTFSGKSFNRSWTGKEVEVIGGKEIQKLWISNDGRLMKVNLPKGVFLEMDQLVDID